MKLHNDVCLTSLNFALYMKVALIIAIALQLLATVHLIVEIIDTEQLLSE